MPMFSPVLTNAYVPCQLFEMAVSRVTIFSMSMLCCYLKNPCCVVKFKKCPCRHVEFSSVDSYNTMGPVPFNGSTYRAQYLLSFHLILGTIRHSMLWRDRKGDFLVIFSFSMLREAAINELSHSFPFIDYRKAIPFIGRQG